MQRKEILCYGDSNTLGCIPRDTPWEHLLERYPPENRWPYLLSEILGPSYHVWEEGLGGRTTIYSPPDFEYLNGLHYLLPCLYSHRPLDLVIILLGTNDLALEIPDLESNLCLGMKELVQLVKASPECGRGHIAPKILIISPTHIKHVESREDIYTSFKGEQGIRLSHQFSSAYHTLAKEMDCFYMDAAAIVSPSDIDGVHWTAEAHHRFAEELANEVRTILE